MLHVSRILSLWQSLGIPTQLLTPVFLQSFDLDKLGPFFFFFLLSSQALRLVPLWLLGFKPFGLTTFSQVHFLWPFVISLGLGVVIFRPQQQFFLIYIYSKIFLRRKCLKINSFSVFFHVTRIKVIGKKNRKENQAIIVTTGSVAMAKCRKELV